MNKTEIRNLLLQKRKNLNFQEYVEYSAAIRQKLLGLEEMQAISGLLTYVSSKDNEVDTWGIIQWALNKGIRVYIPKVHENKTLGWYTLPSLQELRVGRFNILEPIVENGEPKEFPQSSVVLVPGIAFTRRGHRIGYGGGYFDRFLQSFMGTRIGLAFDFQIIDHFPVAPNDVPLHIIITEKEVIRCTTYADD